MMNHQPTAVCRLVVHIQAFYAEASLVSVSMFLCYEKPAQGRTSAPRTVAEVGLLGGRSTSGAMHHISAGHYLA